MFSIRIGAIHFGSRFFYRSFIAGFVVPHFAQYHSAQYSTLLICHIGV